MSTPDPLELLPRPWRIVNELDQDVIRCATGHSVFWHPAVRAHMVEAVNAYADTGQAPEPVMTETVRKLARRLSRTRREFAEVMPCTWCNGIGVVPEEAFGRDEDGAPMVDGVQPCPEGCELPGWLVAERNDARDDAAELDRLSAAAVPATGQAREQGVSGRAAKLGAAVDQERADQLATGLMALADDMRSMAGQWPDNAAARNAYGVAEMRARNLVAADRETENHFRPEPAAATVQAPDVAAAVLAAAVAWKARYDEMFDEPPARGTTMRPIYDALLGTTREGKR